MSLRRDLIKLGADLSEENNAAHDLWTWLPSYRIAQKYHGDYATEHQPSVKDVLTEAATYVAHLRAPDTVLSEQERQRFERCPCGESHNSEGA